MQNLLIGGAAIFALWFLGKQRFLNRSMFRVVGASVTGSFMNPTLNLKIEIANPTNSASNIRALIANISTGGVLVGTINLQNTITVQPGVTVIDLPVRLVVGGLLQSVNNIMTLKPNNYQITGTANVDGLNLPFNIQYEFTA